MATKSWPPATVRESIETPANRATGSRPPGGLTPSARATSSTVHRIESSRGWVSLVWGHPRISVPYRYKQTECRQCLPASLATASVSIPALAQDSPRHGAVVKIDSAVAQHLVGFVPFAREQHDVAGARLIESEVNGLLPVRLDEKLR